jgi:acyl dehydratase
MSEGRVLETIHSGQRLIYRRRIGNEDIRAFAELSGDLGDHHVTPDEQGRLVAHGLLVISTATRMGSDIHYLAHTMTWMFIRPVYGGDEVEARVELKRVVELDDRLDVEMVVRIVNQDGRQVVRGESTGVIIAPHIRTLFSDTPPGAVKMAD